MHVCNNFLRSFNTTSIWAQCILWNRVLERSFGVGYWSGVESNFGEANVLGIFSS